MVLFLQVKNIFLTCVIFLFIGTGYAQSIRGKVTDAQSGESLTGATVMLDNNGEKQYTSAGLDGSFQFKNIRPGSYRLQAEFIGFQTSAAREINIAGNGQPQYINFKMQARNTEMNEVMIKGRVSKETDRSARSIEKNASSIENVLSANTIQLLPDVTVANTLQRVSGVTIQRSASGEGRYAIIRGMDQRYNSTLVNGIKIPSPDPQYRFVPMDIFPSEMLERLEVIKALTPSMEVTRLAAL